MRNIPKKKLSQLFIAAGFFLVILLLLTIIALWKLNTAAGMKFESQLLRYQAQQQAIVRILNNAYLRSLSLHNMSIIQDPFAKDAMFLHFREYGERLISDREFLGTTNSTAEELQVWRQIRDTLNNGGSLQYQIIDAMEADKNDFAQDLLVNKLQPLQERLQQHLDKLSQIKEAKLLRQQSEMKSVDSRITALMYIFGVVAALLGIVTYKWIRSSVKAEHALLKQARQYKALYHLSASADDATGEQIRETLRLLCVYLGMDSAKLSKADIRRRNLTFIEIVDLTGSLIEMEKNNVVNLDKSMSGLCLDNAEPVFIADVSSSLYAQSNLYESGNTSSFIGVTLIVGGQIYGSLSFFKHQPRNREFSASDIELVKVAAQWISIRLQVQSLLKLEIDNQVNEKSSHFETRFYSNINHELRTPLNAIIGYSELLMSKDFRDDDQSDEIARKIRLSGHHLLSLVDNILDLTRLETGKVNLSVEEFPVMNSVNSVVESLDYVFLQTNTRFVSSQFLGSMQTDKEKLQQILQIMIENICQYSKQSEVTMKISEVKKDGEEFLAFSLSGNIGLQNLASKLLDIVNDSVKRHWDYGRMEMGFSLCHRYSKILGGSLSVAEEAGKSTAFQLLLPRYLPMDSVWANVG